MPPYLLIFFSLLIFTTTSQQQQNAQPDQVIELFRHGARAPNSDYDPQWLESELGTLTKIGMTEHYYLGKTFPLKYPHLVASGYNPDDVYVLANYVDRCIESAMVQVSSIFRGTSSTVKESLPKEMQEVLIAKYEPLLPADESQRGDYVPVNVKVVTTEEEKLFFNGKDGGFCNKMTDYINENLDGQQMKDAWKVFQTPANQANAQLPDSQKIKDMDSLATAFDAMIADVFDHRPLPGNITDVKLIKSLDYGLAAFVYIREQAQLIQRQLTSFQTLEGILQQMENFRLGKNPKKFALYGGHDKNLLAILAAFGVITEECLMANYQNHLKDEDLTYPNCQYPGFASNLIFEFYNDAKNPYVKFYYNDALIPLCNGQESCAYQDFRTFVRKAAGDNTIESWNKQCGNSTFNFWKIFGIIIGVLIGVIMILGCRYLKRRAARRQGAEDKIMLKLPSSQTDQNVL